MPGLIVEKIPAKAYKYVINGKSAIECILDRYQMKIHKENGIKKWLGYRSG